MTKMNPIAVSVASLSLCLLLGLTTVDNHSIAVAAAKNNRPAYSAAGDLLPPSNYREWIYLSSGIDMSYTPRIVQAQDQHQFDNVFVNPEAYRTFLQSGTWPDKTLLVLERRPAKSAGSINKSGHFQDTKIGGIEVHVKDTTHFPGGWAFFDFENPTAPGKIFKRDANCYSCHQDHGAVDTTFVQFYPTLLPVAQQKQTLSAAYLNEGNICVRLQPISLNRP